MSETTYTVQVAFIPSDTTEVVYASAEHVGGCWKDIATVTVPRKSPRKRVIGEALRQSGIRPAPDAEPLRVRVLDVASASETKVVPYQPEALWRVG